MAEFPDMTGRTLLQVIPELDAGGAERTVLEMVEAVATAGGHALVVSEGGRMVADLEALGGRFIPMRAKSKNPLTIRKNAAELAKLITAENIDLIHARSRAPAWSAYWAAQRTGIPFVTTYHGAYSARTSAKRLYNSVMARGQRVIANSEWTAAQVMKEHDISPPQLVTIPRGVDLLAFDPERIGADRIQALRQSWQLPDDRAIVLLPGRLTSWKGQLLALDALADLTNAERDRLFLVIAGDAQGRTEYVQSLQDKITDLGLSGVAALVPHCRDMPAAYLAAGMVLSASTRPEAFGRVAAEASAMGCFVIASDHGGARETIIDGDTGIRFHPGDAKALAGAFRTALSLPEESRIAMGEAGRAFISANYSKHQLQAKTLGVYADVLTGIGAPSDG
ncbi:MAG: glycosyltransferase family 4 protein [Pseudomonadota bacterium]